MMQAFRGFRAAAALAIMSSALMLPILRAPRAYGPRGRSGERALRVASAQERGGYSGAALRAIRARHGIGRPPAINLARGRAA
jgi:hypothetical protein